MNTLESKLKDTKGFLGSLDTALREHNDESIKELIVGYIRESVTKTAPDELTNTGSLLLEGYLALNSHKTVLTLNTLDKIFSGYIQKLKKLQASGKRPEIKDTILNDAKKHYTEKKAEVLLYEAGDELEAGTPEGNEKLNYGNILSAVKKYNEACELSGTNDSQKKNLAKAGNISFEKGNLREAIMRYGLAGKKPSEVLAKVSWACMGKFLDAASKATDETDDVWYANHDAAEKLLVHFKSGGAA